jgi:hypothetical protein
LVRHLAGADQVAPAYLGAVKPEVPRRQLDQPLAKERAFIAARRAIGAGRGLVGEQRCRGQPHIRHAIGAGQGLRQRARLDQSVGPDIRSEIDKHLAAHAEDGAVAAASDLDLAICLARMVHRRQMLAPVFEPADRPVGMPRSERDQEVLGIELAAGAKAAATSFSIRSTWAGDRPSIAARVSRLKNGTFAAPSTVIRPCAVSHSASTPRGSIGNAVWRWTENRRYQM